MFQFEEKYYKHNSGVSMGSPLSSILSDIVMTDFETILNEPKLKQIRYYWYVDDTLILYREEKLFFEDELNSINPFIRFSKEVKR